MIKFFRSGFSLGAGALLYITCVWIGLSLLFQSPAWRDVRWPSLILVAGMVFAGCGAILHRFSPSFRQLSRYAPLSYELGRFVVLGLAGACVSMHLMFMMDPELFEFWNGPLVVVANVFALGLLFSFVCRYLSIIGAAQWTVPLGFGLLWLPCLTGAGQVFQLWGLPDPVELFPHSLIQVLPLSALSASGILSSFLSFLLTIGVVKLGARLYDEMRKREGNVRVTLDLEVKQARKVLLN